MNRSYSLLLKMLILLVTAGAFAYYLADHRNLLDHLLHTPVPTIVWLSVLYLAWFGALSLTVQATLRMCRCNLRLGENLLLNAYSVLVNFFVPGQGGVAVRGVYVKKRYGLTARRFILATLIYYMSLAIVSGFMLLMPSRPWWQTMLGVTIIVVGGIMVIFGYERRSETRADALDLRAVNLGFLLFATFVQASVQATIYAYELKSVNPDVSLLQAVCYTGAANFSIFVALTPGAIGIRESFLFFSQKLHHVSTSTIVAASVIDRSVFLILLGLLFLITLVFHTKRALRVG